MISILDCTLRDGGYINDFDFGKEVIQSIIYNLSKSQVEIIECGFLQSGKNDPDKSLFKNIDSIKNHIPSDTDSMYVAMIAYGDISIDEIEPCDGKTLTGIRLTFHEKDIDDAFVFAKKLMDKKYKVFIQPVGTTAYTDCALLDLIGKVNEMSPFAFYLVDTLGTLYKNDLLRMFYLINNNLDPKIKIGFHSHNNLQLSFSNAQELMLMNSKRDIIIDASVFGMGRGAGNLCTELITQYINKNIEDKYNLIPILEIMDEYIMPIYARHPWGYSAPYCLAAINNCHPSYAAWLMEKQTICIRDINAIIKSIPSEKKHLYDNELINKLYLEYQQRNVDDSDTIKKLSDLCKNRSVLILAPGKSLITMNDTISEYIKNNDPVVFAINHIPSEYKYDKVFISNLKRFKGIDDAAKKIKDKIIFTSNITDDSVYDIVNYSEYLINDEAISDNSGLMLINVIRKAGVNSIALAGYDGFKYNENTNYFDNKMINGIQYEKQQLVNKAIISYFTRLKKIADVKFITPTIYNGEGNDE